MVHPPTPNEAISLDVSNTSKTAYLNEGFEILLSSDTDLVGAYLRFKTNDGTLADSYYDINIASNLSNKSSIGVTKKNKRVFGKTAKVDDESLDIDFNSKIEAGTFCYELCVYDGQGNISAPTEVCVTVESWGGNSELVASWTAIRDEFVSEDGTIITNVGEESCDDVQTFDFCTNGGSFEYQNCYTINFFDIVFMADGTYEFADEGISKSLNSAASDDNCDAVFFNDTYGYTSSGNWAYVQSEKRLTLVEYSYNETDGENEWPGTYEPGEGYLLFDGPTEIVNGVLMISDTYDQSGANDLVTEKYFFEKK